MNNFIVDKSDIGKYVHTLPNMYDDDLDPYEYRLMGHYKRVGTCYESTRTTAEKTQMSIGKVSQTRKALIERNLIAIETISKKRLFELGYISEINQIKGDQYNEICLITVVDVMEENTRRYAGQGGVHVVNTPVHDMNKRITTTTIVSTTGKIFDGYTDHCGPLSPFIRDMLEDDISEYGEMVVLDALREAVSSKGGEHFSWKYVQAILKNWKERGRDNPNKLPAQDWSFGIEIVNDWGNEA